MGQRVKLTENMLRGMVRKAISEEIMRLDEAKHNYSRDARKVIYDWLVENGRIKPFDNGISDVDKNEKIKTIYKIKNIEQKFLDSFMHGYSNYKDPLKRLEPIFLKIALENGWWSHSPNMEVVRGLRMILNYLIECYNKSGGGDVIISSDVDEKNNVVKNYYLRDIQPGITYEQLKSLCSNAFDNNGNNRQVDANKAKTEEYKTDTGYTIIPNINFLQAHDIGKWSGGLGSTRLCYTGSKGVWDQYTNSGENTVYVLLKDDYKEMQPEEYANHEDRPYDPYGESMIFLFVDPNGNLKYSNVRWNHCFQELGGNKTDHNYTKEGIEKLTGLSFDDNFVNVGNEENEKYLTKVENILAGREKNVKEVDFTIQKFNIKKGLYIITVSSGQANVFDENSGQMLYSKWFDSTNCYYQENNLLYYRVFVGEHQNIIRPNGDLLFDGPPSEWPKEVSRCDGRGFLIFTTDDDKENYIHLNEGYILYEPNDPEKWFKRCFSFTRKGWAKAVFFNGLYNIIDANGNVAYEPENPDMWFSVCDYPNENGITKVAYNNDKFTFLDAKKGVIIYEPNNPDKWFDRAVRQLENILIVKDSKQYYLLTAEGAIVTLNGDGLKYLHEKGIELHRIFTTVEQYEGSNLVYIEFDGHCNLLKDETTILLPIWPTDIFFYSQGVARAKFGPAKWNFIDANGNIMYEPNNPQNWFNHTTPFDENGISIVEFDGAENYFRTNGTFLFPNTWLDHCNAFQDGLARIKLNGKYNYTDVNGNILFPNTWFKFCSHYFNEKGLGFAQLESGNYLIDKNGNFYDPYTQQQVNPPSGGNNATNEAIIKLKNKINRFVNEAILRYYGKSNLNEGLIKTYPIDKTISYIKKHFDLDDEQIDIVCDYDVEIIMVYIPDVGDNRKLMEKAMNLCGYYLAYTQPDRKNKKRIVMQFEPKYQEDITEELRQGENYLFHITPRYNLEKIKRFGLSPKFKNDFLKFPDRVYFIKGSTDMEDVMNCGEQLFDNNKSIGNNGKYALLLINLSKIPNDVKFYEDGNYPYGVFTYSNIPPNCIVWTDYIDY